ncbi:hypothetical protein [Glycomyces niveus]|uniref:DUF5753 domain-containing protein n=1 Tax=Glycomyces niveus TaxID=2820287 RepID=A0ABS3U6V8_9ACTN|nr:hypothetical protein [Glycomyces sp. NEAU-S30]MBO3734503.1 hypothetical protein [Glycomyces sp. NEAU-S30]
MIPDRYTTRRIRARYIKALNAIPLPVRRTDPPDPALPIDLAGLPILATHTIDDRAVRYSLVMGQTRLRLTFKDTCPALIGHIINLETDNPRLIIAEPLQTEWALANETALLHHAAKTWQVNTKTCRN